MSINALSGKVFLLITGASRGIGKQIAETFSAVLEKGSHVLLLATNIQALQETAKLIPSHIAVDYKAVDLSKAEQNELQEIVLHSLNGTTPGMFERVVIVHNVGTIGDLSKQTSDMMDLKIWQNYYNLNLFLPAVLTGVVLKIFNNSNSQKLVINISSLLGLEPVKNMGYYCTVKAAKEMFFKVLALEHPSVDVLNYAPGPVTTDMFNTVCDTVADETVKKQFNEMRTTNTALSTQQTVQQLLKVLEQHKYKSGAHVDYYDEI